MTKSLADRIKHRINHEGRGWCCSQNDFSDLGNYDAIRQALSRLCQAGLINRRNDPKVPYRKLCTY